jgi:2-oxoglutarate ferredoxin oxidoreductase subunit alpha
MERLLHKFDTARTLVPQPLARRAPQPTRFGAIYYGSTSPAMAEAITLLEAEGLLLDTLRVRAYPFPESVREFIAAHDAVYIVEQNRDAQLRSLVVNEFDVDPARVPAVLHYDGTPITARYIARAIGERMRTAAAPHDSRLGATS